MRSAGIRDWFDLAEALLDRASVQQALERLSRPVLAVLAAASELARGGGAPTAEAIGARIGTSGPEVVEQAAEAVAEALLGEESGRYAPWDAVAEQLAAWPSFGLPGLEELVWEAAPLSLVSAPRPDQDRVDALAVERAWQSVERLVQLALELAAQPARLLSRGGVALPETRRLAAAAGIEQDELAGLLDLATQAELVDAAGGELRGTPAAANWTGLEPADRWRSLVERWLAGLSAQARSLLSTRPVWGTALEEHLDWLYPAAGAVVRDRIRAAQSAAELLGITVDGVPSLLGAPAFRDPEEAAALLRERFPVQIDRVYLQHDLTVISPGPLRTDLDARLRRMAVPEARGLAPSYRFTEASLAHAIGAGEDEASIREFLGRISLTGLPQPLDYLLSQTAARYGTVRVGPPPIPTIGTRSLVVADDELVLERILVDSALAPLGLRRAGEHRAGSAVEPAVLFWALVDARYPATAVDADGAPVALGRAQRERPAPEEPARNPARDLVPRLRGAGTGTAQLDGGAWIARQLELAARGRVTVIVSARMPSGQIAEFRLEPSSVAGGRLRGRDAAADIERTLPIASITAVTPLD